MVWALFWACAEPGVVVKDQQVGAACGTCVFHMPDMKGCFWAVEIEGQFYAVGGVTPPDDMVTAHSPEGMCAVERQAMISGEIRPDGRFLATRFELLPYQEGQGRTATPHAH